MKSLWIWRAKRAALKYHGLCANEAWLEALWVAHKEMNPADAVNHELDSDYPTI